MGSCRQLAQGPPPLLCLWAPQQAGLGWRRPSGEGLWGSAVDCVTCTSPWELGTGVVGDSGVAKACDGHGEDGQQLATPTTPLRSGPTQG